ncbi:Chitin synthase, class 3 [Chytridiales sp. JEL 0842]|nr:Chitin synthase, class 3 [Chytridiales sp. JEL 0842]
MQRKKSLIKPERSKSYNDNSPNSMHYPLSPTHHQPSSSTSAALAAAGSLKRRRQQGGYPAETLVRNDNGRASLKRRQTTMSHHSANNSKNSSKGPKTSWWVRLSRCLTFFLPSPVLRSLGKREPSVQQAYREKVALCVLVFLMMAIVGFLTFGFQTTVCIPTNPVKYSQLASVGYIAIRGRAWTFKGLSHPVVQGQNLDEVMRRASGADLTALFPIVGAGSACSALTSSRDPLFPCTARTLNGQTLWPDQAISSRFNPPSPFGANAGCHLRGQVDLNLFLQYQGTLVVDWEEMQTVQSGLAGKNWIVYNGLVLDVSALLAGNGSVQNFFGPETMSIIRSHIGKDSTRAFTISGRQTEAQCLAEYLRIASIDSLSTGCLASQIIVTTSFIVIITVVMARFVLAMYFTYVIGWRLGNSKEYQRAMDDYRRRRAEFGRVGEAAESRTRNRKGEFTTPNGSDQSTLGSGKDVIDIPLEGLGRLNQGSSANKRSTIMGSTTTEARAAAHQREMQRDTQDPARRWSANFGFMDMESKIDSETEKMLNDPTLMHTLVMVPCYSEGESSLKATLNSIAHSYYPSTHKVLFVIADGIVKGAENVQTTPDILIDMIEVDERFRKDDPRWGGEPEAFSYVAIADGANRKNYARVYAGWYRYDLKDTEASGLGGRKKGKKIRNGEDDDSTLGGSSRHGSSSSVGGDDDGESPAYIRTLKQRSEGRVPMLLIVKVGNEEERNPDNPANKPGNRGKRDSQVILMNFLAKVMFDDRMTELEFDIFFKLFTITGVNPDRYEAVLMVDADTRIFPDSLTHMVACLLRDDRIMGLCGETKISNKWDSWVTMIQVFEYYISHHLAKAFESVFGGVTCLPGCFSMYRIKTPKGPNGYWVPILANPDVVEEYSENIVDTLHKKNLLLLGEDRFLSTMMLRNFPKRRMVFCPPAICKTVVPDTFKVLLSQRRRWINSTIHNLMELMLVKDLCGTFCISMQFVIFMELVGTVVLPAAITFTLTLCVMAIFKIGDTTLPLILLAIILGLPAVLIVLTANRLIYIFWMFIYLFSLPIWNFILPLYAFWHFDDFSWGETRRTAGDIKGHDHSKAEGEFDGSGIHMKRWSEWVKARRAEAQRAERESFNRGSVAAPPGFFRPPIGTMQMNPFRPPPGGFNAGVPPPPGTMPWAGPPPRPGQGQVSLSTNLRPPAPPGMQVGFPPGQQPLQRVYSTASTAPSSVSNGTMRSNSNVGAPSSAPVLSNNPSSPPNSASMGGASMPPLNYFQIPPNINPGQPGRRPTLQGPPNGTPGFPPQQQGMGGYRPMPPPMSTSRQPGGVPARVNSSKFPPPPSPK